MGRKRERWVQVEFVVGSKKNKIGFGISFYD